MTQVIDLGRYPTIAVSDFVLSSVAWACVYEGFLLHGQLFPAFGYMLVAIASAFGVLRFGFSPLKFRALNETTAETAAFVGTPMVIYCFLRVTPVPPESVALALFVIFTTTRTLSREIQERVVIVINALFISAAAWQAYLLRDTLLLASLGLFLIVGLAVGNDRHSRLLGVRRENIFHYGLALVFVMFFTAKYGELRALNHFKGYIPS